MQSNNVGLPKGRLDSVYKEGVLFITYALLVQNSKAMEDNTVTTVSEAKALKSESIPKRSRLEQIVDWLKGESKPLIIFDECHKAKNLIASKGGMSSDKIAIC